MNIKILQPNENRKEIFEKSVKPLLIAAEENNAVDKWMFNLKEDGSYDQNSTVYVSSKHMRIFIIQGISEIEKPYLEKRKKLQRDLGYFNKMVHRLSGSQRMVRVDGVRKPFKWMGHLFQWNIGDDNYAGTGFSIEGISDVPSLQELCKKLDFDLWVQGDLSGCIF